MCSWNVPVCPNALVPSNVTNTFSVGMKDYPSSYTGIPCYTVDKYYFTMSYFALVLSNSVEVNPFSAASFTKSSNW